MIEVKELRVGNLILGKYIEEDDETEKEKEVVCEVEGLDNTGFFEYSIWVQSKTEIEEFIDFDPIPINEEWLKRFGAKRDSRKQWILHNRIILKREDGFYDYASDVKLELVHQTQNFFYAHGYELTLNK